MPFFQDPVLQCRKIGSAPGVVVDQVAVVIFPVCEVTESHIVFAAAEKLCERCGEMGVGGKHMFPHQSGILFLVERLLFIRQF